ncbi:hypothetical protein POM88_036106 [Heracleum sosnowskyi]|uniref:Uncharacterized protein n=1 Tax=Heracleum sosnowskyi TaxID=360622 RepID=A0AAD8HMQ7_9APIA|nr:hypothetical protein POM88_036106 [Heracleum sosnowskyi]
MHIQVDSIVSDGTHSDFELQPGPRDPSVLHLQAEHRFTHIWNAGGDTQRSRIRTKFPALHPKMVLILRDLRFDGVARLANATFLAPNENRINHSSFSVLSTSANRHLSRKELRNAVDTFCCCLVGFRVYQPGYREPECSMY